MPTSSERGQRQWDDDVMNGHQRRATDEMSLSRKSNLIKSGYGYLLSIGQADVEVSSVSTKHCEVFFLNSSNPNFEHFCLQRGPLFILRVLARYSVY